MSIEVNKIQTWSKGLKTAILTEAEDAMRFLPIEDKINMALKLNDAPCIDDDRDASRALSEAKQTIADALSTIDTLTTKIASMETSEK